MTITVVRYAHRGDPAWGILRNARLIPIPGDYPTTGALIAGTTAAGLSLLEGDGLPLEHVELLAPVTGNQQFVCQGANYRQHMIESGMNPDAKTFNMIFTKARSSIAPAHADVVRPASVKFLDYEVELGLILRKAISSPTVVTHANLHEYVAGVVVVNDYSARDVQVPQMQFYKGKSFRTFGPVGPYLVLLEQDDFARLDDLELRLTVNGEVRQQDTAANMVFKPAETLTELSGVQNFQAGDLLSTGTPAGCALAVPKPVVVRLLGLLPDAKKWSLFSKLQAKRPYLQPGDVVEASIRTADGALDLGVQRNHIVEAA
jgi:2-keto-4-pentenoate hydratase/2-oxohepta-3-ene-1,7-dioic acid hydratase in catechol pathway